MKKTAKFYHDNPVSYAKKKARDTEAQDTGERRAYKRRHQRARVAKGIAGKGGGDLHDNGGKLVRMSVSKNRGMPEKSRLKGSKRNKGYGVKMKK